MMEPTITDNSVVESPVLQSSIDCGFNVLQLTKRGLMVYPRADAVIGQSLSYYGEYAENDLAIISQLIKPGDHVMDLGAHVGVHALFMAQQVGASGVMVALEPQRILFQDLCANMALNGVTNAHCCELAVGDKSEMIQMPFIDYFQKQDFGQIAPNPAGSGEGVKQICLDEMHLARCDLIKMSVFSNAMGVIQGASNTLKHLQPTLYIEWTSCEPQPGLLYTLLTSMGYKLYWSLSPMYSPNNLHQKTDDIFENSLLINILCIHQARDFALQGFTPIQSPGDDWRQIL